MTHYHIIGAKDLTTLMSKISKYDISSLGSLLVSNSYYTQSFLGSLKETLVTKETCATEVIPEVTKVPEVKPKKPKVTKSKPRVTKSKPKVTKAKDN